MAVVYSRTHQYTYNINVANLIHYLYLVQLYHIYKPNFQHILQPSIQRHNRPQCIFTNPLYQSTILITSINLISSIYFNLSCRGAIKHRVCTQTVYFNKQLQPRHSSISPPTKLSLSRHILHPFGQSYRSIFRIHLFQYTILAQTCQYIISMLIYGNRHKPNF